MKSTQQIISIRIVPYETPIRPSDCPIRSERSDDLDVHFSANLTLNTEQSNVLCYTHKKVLKQIKISLST